MSKTYFSFLLDQKDITKEQIEDINALSEILEQIGGYAELNMHKEEKIPLLQIGFREDKMKKVLTRSAGKKRNVVYDSQYTFGDIRVWKRSGIKATEIMERLNCNRNTYYRRMQEADKLGFSDDTRWIG